MSDKHKKLKSKKGMTLAEALVASAVLVIMVAGILAVIGFANTIIAKNKV